MVAPGTARSQVKLTQIWSTNYHFTYMYNV
jgi:hypothetical protein